MPKRVFKTDEKDTLRLTMLEAGFPLLKEYGMTHTTISKLTDAAGIAKGTFYHFWKDKENYMSDLILYHRQKMIPQIVSSDVLEGKRKLGREDARKRNRYADILCTLQTHQNQRWVQAQPAYIIY